MNPIRIVLIDDHQIVRQGIVSILNPDPRFAIAGEASTGLEGIKIVEEVSPDIVILDLKLPDITGVEVCKQILERAPTIKILVLTAYFEREMVYACLHAGAKGYLIKDADQLNLPEKLLEITQGHTILDPRATDALTDYLYHQNLNGDTLSQRELEVIRLISQGLTNREIAFKLSLTENTIKGYVKNIYHKLEARNRIEAVAVARKKGML